MVTTNNKRLHQILQLFKSVEESGITTKEYFKKHKPTISISQYFRLKKRYQEGGEADLVDQRHRGNARKISEEQVNLIRSVLTYNRHLPSSVLEDDLKGKWGVELFWGKDPLEQYARAIPHLVHIVAGGCNCKPHDFAERGPVVAPLVLASQKVQPVDRRESPVMVEIEHVIRSAGVQ